MRSLEPGETRTAELHVTSQYRSVVQEDGKANFWSPKIVVLAGMVSLHVASDSSLQGALTANFTTSGGALTTSFRCAEEEVPVIDELRSLKSDDEEVWIARMQPCGHAQQNQSWTFTAAGALQSSIGAAARCVDGAKRSGCGNTCGRALLETCGSSPVPPAQRWSPADQLVSGAGGGCLLIRENALIDPGILYHALPCKNTSNEQWQYDRGSKQLRLLCASGTCLPWRGWCLTAAPSAPPPPPPPPVPVPDGPLSATEMYRTRVHTAGHPVQEHALRPRRVVKLGGVDARKVQEVLGEPVHRLHLLVPDTAVVTVGWAGGGRNSFITQSTTVTQIQWFTDPVRHSVARWSASMYGGLGCTKTPNPKLLGPRALNT